MTIREDLKQALLEDQVLTLAEWREINNLSERTANRLIKRGDGPKITWLSDRRRGVTVANNRKWIASRERA